MLEDETKKPEPEENKEGLGPISRREFTISSMAALGAATLSPLSPDTPAWKIEKSEEVRQLMDEWHILDNDLIKVIEHAEKTGEKLYQPGTDRFLSKVYIQEVYFYTEYSPVEGGYRIHSAYSHRFTLEEG